MLQKVEKIISYSLGLLNPPDSLLSCHPPSPALMGETVKCLKRLTDHEWKDSDLQPLTTRMAMGFDFFLGGIPTCASFSGKIRVVVFLVPFG